jgi:hypothetical protein
MSMAVALGGALETNPGRPGIRSRFVGAARALQEHAPLVVALACLLWPALHDLLSDRRRAYGYLAPDAFYYFTIAVNWVEHGLPSFDQVHPTNGFHPLWQWMMAGTYATLRALGESRFELVPVAVALGLVLLALTLVVLWRMLRQSSASTAWFALVPVGIWPLLVSPLWWRDREALPEYRRLPLFGTLWNSANGLETALVLLLFAACTHCFVSDPTRSSRRAWGYGLLLGGLSLARLDHAVFAFVFAVGTWVTARLEGDRQKMRRSLSSAGIAVAIVSVYLVYNLVTVGRAMPMSGAVKSTFPRVSLEGLSWLWSLRDGEPRPRVYGVGRLGGIVGSAVIALIYLAIQARVVFASRPWRRSLRALFAERRLSACLTLTACGVLAIATYNMAFVVHQHIGEWYAPVSLLFVSLVSLQGLSKIGRHWRRGGPSWRARAGGITAAGVMFGLAALDWHYFTALHALPRWGAQYATFCEKVAPRVLRHFKRKRPPLLSRDDGVVAFATGLPITSGTRLALDAEAAEAARAGHFEELLIRRSVDRLTAFGYLDSRRLRRGERSERVQRHAENILLEPPRRAYEVEYQDGNLAILRATGEDVAQHE